MYPFFLYVLMTFLVSVIAVLLLSRVFPPTGKETPKVLRSQHAERRSDAVALNQLLILGTLTFLHAARGQIIASLNLISSESWSGEAKTNADLNFKTIRHQVSSHQEAHANTY